MLDRSDILRLIPHQGRMCLIDRIEHWDCDRIEGSAVSHLDPTNPLRRDGGLAAICGVEYGLQIAAAHGALMDGAPQGPGYLASLRALRLHVARLDDPAFVRLTIRAEIPLRERSGLMVAFELRAGAQQLLSGRATIFLPPA